MAKEIRPLYRANDSTGVDEIFYPATTTDAIAHPTKQKSLTTVLGEIENGSVYDISAAHNNQPYVDLAAALGTNGVNVPQSLHKGGIIVKFIRGTVQSSDNKYVQYRFLLSGSFTAEQFTNTANWVSEDVDAYYVCDSAESSARKDIANSESQGNRKFRFLVKMTYKNTASYARIKFGDVDKDIRYNGNIASAKNTWDAGDILDVYYDGSYFHAESIDKTKVYADFVRNSLEIGKISKIENYGYLTGWNKFAFGASAHCLFTKVFTVVPGEVLKYKGRGLWDGKSIIFFNSEKQIIESKTYQSTDAYVDVTVPNNAAYAQASSWDDIGNNLVLDIKLSSNILGRLSPLESSISTVQGKISALKENVESLNDSVDAMMQVIPLKADLELIYDSVNMFDYASCIDSCYIDQTTGKLVELGYTNLRYKVSAPIKVIAGEVYNVHRNTMTYSGGRYLDANMNPILPTDGDGTQFPSYQMNPSQATKVPSNAVYFQFQVEFDSETNSQAQFEKGWDYTGYEPYSVHYSLKEDELPTQVKELVKDSYGKGLCNIKNVGQNSYVQLDFDENNYLTIYFEITRNPSYLNNPTFNLVKAQLINKTTGVVTEVHNNYDDIAPVWMSSDAQQIASNHGAFGVIKLTLSNHGKTYEDIGSTWTHNGITFTIIGVYDGYLLVLSDNIKTYPEFAFSTNVVSPYTFVHSSGATHTSTFTATSIQVTQWWPIVGNQNVKVFVNEDKVEINSGIHTFAKLAILETYNVFNPASLLSKIKTAVGTFNANPNNAELGADLAMAVTNTYMFDDEGTLRVFQNIMPLQNINMVAVGISQQQKLSGTCSLYVPNVHSMRSGTDSIDLRTPQQLSTLGNKSVSLTDCDTNKLPNRYIEEGQYVAFAGGYLPVGDFENRGSNVVDGPLLNISSEYKIYPFLYYKANAHNTIAGGFYRKYIPLGKLNDGNIYSSYTIKGEDYNVYVSDFKASGVYNVMLKAEDIGKDITIMEKSEGIDVISKVGGCVTVKATLTNGVYGNVVFKV